MIELLKTVAIQAAIRNNIGESDNTLVQTTALQAIKVYTPVGDNKLMSTVAAGKAGYKGGDGITLGKTNYTYGVIQSNIK